MKFTQKTILFFESLNLIIKLIMLVLSAVLFFFLFPFLLERNISFFYLFISLLFLFGLFFRIIAGKKTFRLTIILWSTGSVVYLILAFFLILNNVQPLPYLEMDKPSMILYYLSYPLRVLGIFFTGLFFAGITSPAEFLRWGSIGLKIALLYRAFEYSITSFEENRTALTIQGNWPDPDSKNKFKTFFKIIKLSPLLIAITFRNIILWFPWAWICYTNLKKDFFKQ